MFYKYEPNPTSFCLFPSFSQYIGIRDRRRQIVWAMAAPLDWVFVFRETGKSKKARKKEGLKESCCAKWHNCAILLFPGRNVPTGVFEAQIVRFSTALDAFKLGSFIFNSSDGSFPLNDSAGAVLLNLFLLWHKCGEK